MIQLLMLLRSAHLRLRVQYFALFAICGAISPSLAQKVENDAVIPPSVRPGAIEAQLEVEVAPGVTMAPQVVSPYEPEQPKNAGAIEFVLSDVRLDGADAVSPSALQSLYADKIGATVALSEIFAIARAITRRYAEEGYPLSLAYVPVQEIENGVVRIRIIEGFIGEIAVTGVDGGVERQLAKIGEKIKQDRPLTQKKLERYLLLANRLPGVKVTGVLERGEAADRGVRMTLKAERKRVAVAAGANNRASRAVGREQFYGRAKLNGVAMGVDDFNFTAVQSFNLDELSYFAAGYSTLLTSEGLRLNLKATRSEAAPGIPFLRVLGFESEGWTAGADVTYPLLLRRKTQLQLSGGFRWKQFKSAFGVSPNTLDELWTSEFAARLSHTDDWNGANKAGLTIVKGWDIFDATQAGSPLASRAGAGGEFTALVADIGRKQKVADWASLSVSLKAQTANNPLLSSEQCGFGGAGFGRGYDPFEIAGDRCIVGLVELAMAPAFLSRGKFKAAPFVSFDAGAVRQIGDLAFGEARTGSLYSLGAGVRMTMTKHLSASAEVGAPLKGVVSQEGDDDPRFFFSLEARY